MENVVSAPRVMSSCLPISTISMSLVGLESRSTMFPASLAAEVPVFIATPTSAWASAGASLVPSPVIATSLPPACSRLMRAILSSGVASARKSSTPASSAIALAVSGLSPVIMTVLMPMRRSSSNRSRMPSLTTSLRWMTPRTRAPVARPRRRPAAACRPPRRSGRRARRRPSETVPPCSRTQAMTEPAAPLRILRAVDVHARHTGLGGEGDPLGAGQFALVALAQPVLLLRQDDDGAALGRLVGQRRQLGGVGEFGLRRPARPARTRTPGGCRA